MSTVLNFEEIEVGNGNQQSERKTVSPGVDVFTVAEAEVKENVNGKQYVLFKFVNKDDKYLKEIFYTTTAKAIGRVKELATNSGVTLGTVTMEQAVAKLIGKKVGLIVEGTKENADIDGNTVVVTRSEIKKAYNFSFKPEELDKYKDSKITIEDKTAVSEEVLPVGANDDLPF